MNFNFKITKFVSIEWVHRFAGCRVLSEWLVFWVHKTTALIIQQVSKLPDTLQINKDTHAVIHFPHYVGWSWLESTSSGYELLITLSINPCAKCTPKNIMHLGVCFTISCHHIKTYHNLYNPSSIIHFSMHQIMHYGRPNKTVTFIYIILVKTFV